MSVFRNLYNSVDILKSIIMHTRTLTYICIRIQKNIRTRIYWKLAKRSESSPIPRETWVESQVESYQRLKKCYLMPPCLTLSIIRYGSRVKWSNPGKGVAPSPTPWCSKLSKREPSGHPRLWSPTLLTYIYIYIYRERESI